ncbi:MAG TPA: SPOR domain-containing protein [Terriglobales bacterium]|nr:SPOR domain-containing protein [Terriglobales bacterium]
MASEDTEITLGTGRMLGLFFLLAAICGVFFSIGYSLGKSSAREQALNDQPSQVLAASPNAASSSQSDDKPSAVIASKPAADPAAQTRASEPTTEKPLTFYKAVQGGADSEQSPAKENPPAAAAKASAVEASPVPAQSAKRTQPSEAAGHSAAGAPPVSHSAPMTGPGTIVVQIAALSREDDAVALAGALRKKDYNVFVVNNPATSDKFYHVQVGPFATLPEADAMKAKLIAEGYNPIVKK